MGRSIAKAVVRNLVEFAALFGLWWLGLTAIRGTWALSHVLIGCVLALAAAKTLFFGVENIRQLQDASARNIPYHKFLLLMLMNVWQVITSFGLDYHLLDLLDPQSFAVINEALEGPSLVARVGDLTEAYGIGRGIHVGETALGIKGRIGFEAGAALVLIGAHRELEKLVLTKWQTFWKDQLGRFYGDRLHEGHYFDPALRDIEALITSSQARVTGETRVRLAAGRFQVYRFDDRFTLTTTDQQRIEGRLSRAEGENVVLQVATEATHPVARATSPEGPLVGNAIKSSSGFEVWSTSPDATEVTIELTPSERYVEQIRVAADAYAFVAATPERP